MSHISIRELRQKLRLTSDDLCLSISSDYSSIGIALITPLTNPMSRTFIRYQDLQKSGLAVGTNYPEFINKLRPLIPIEAYRINDVFIESAILYPNPEGIKPKYISYFV